MLLRTLAAMKFLTCALQLSILGSLAYANPYGLGTSLSLGAAGSTTAITKVTTTLTAGAPPATQQGEIYLYPALSNGTGDFLFSTLESWPDQSWCGGSASQWCIRTSVFGANKKSYYGQFAAADANAPVTFTFEQYANKTGWTLSASVNGAVVSSLSYPSGPMTLFGLTYECDDSCTQATTSQTYTNTVIELEEANPSWGSSTVLGSKIYGDGTAQPPTTKQTVVQGLTSSEGGKVWSIDSITIPISS